MSVISATEPGIFAKGGEEGGGGGGGGNKNVPVYTFYQPKLYCCHQKCLSHILLHAYSCIHMMRLTLLLIFTNTSYLFEKIFKVLLT